MNEDAKIAHRTRILSYALMVIIFVGVTAASFLWNDGNAEGGRLTFSNGGDITLQDSSGTLYEIRNEDLVSVEYHASFDFGSPVGGNTADGIREGLWHSDAAGDYIASADTALEGCVLLRTADTVYALSYESEASTKAIWEALEKTLEKE